MTTEKKRKRGRPRKIKVDLINSPAHYKDGDIECIDAMVSAFGIEAVRVYAKLNAFKYLWRDGKKDSSSDCLRKASWYTRFATGDDPRNDK
jgi:hypothetical protein